MADKTVCISDANRVLDNYQASDFESELYDDAIDAREEENSKED